MAVSVPNAQEALVSQPVPTLPEQDLTTPVPLGYGDVLSDAGGSLFVVMAGSRPGFEYRYVSGSRRLRCGNYGPSMVLLPATRVARSGGRGYPHIPDSTVFDQLPRTIELRD
jgi:hypothetical protein